MKKHLILLLIALASKAIAQSPATTNIGQGKYPLVLPDNKVEFMLKAPDALKVQIDLGKKYDMIKDATGNWRVTTEIQSSGIHYYSLIIDGVSVADPASESFFGCGRMMSCIEIPYPKNEQQYEIANVPHGDIRTNNYFSTTTNSWRKMYVYTPPGYDQSLNTTYPVLYIMHGGGEDARGWVQQGRMNIILDNLIATEKATPMLIVSLDANVGGYQGITREVMENVVPFVESNYRVEKKATKRALAGLSMGGIFTLHIGIPRTDFFHYLGVFSSGWFSQRNSFFGNGEEAKDSYTYLESNKEKVNNNLKLFWIAMGGREDIAYNNCEIMRKRLDELGIKHEYYDSEKGGHTWPVWREDLYLFTQKIFK